MTNYTGTLYLDAADHECPAVYELDVIWMQGEPYVNSVRLDEWTFGGRRQTRETAVALIGDGEVQRQEGEAVEAWLPTAERDRDDDRADSRMWLAAE